MSEWNRLNRLTRSELLRLNARNLHRYINTMPNGNQWNALYNRLTNVRNLKYQTNKGLRQSKAANSIFVWNHNHGKLHNGFPITAQQANRARERIRLINQELARRTKQKIRAHRRAMNAVRALWYKPGVGRGYARHAASVKHRW